MGVEISLFFQSRPLSWVMKEVWTVKVRELQVGNKGEGNVQNSAGKREIVPEAAISQSKLVIVFQIYPVEKFPQDTW